MFGRRRMLSLLCFFMAVGIRCTKCQSLAEIWQHHDHPHQLDKWLEYADNYERHLPQPGKGPVKLLEIGVQSGGSLIAWKKFYGADSTIVGVDIDARCKRSHNPKHGIFVEIGSQLDPAFLDAVCQKYGPFDVIIDDGGHTDGMITTSLYHLFPNDACLKRDGGVYAVEDLHTMVMKTYMPSHVAITKNVIGKAFLSMHAHWDTDAGQAAQYAPVFRGNVVGMHLYDSLIILQKGSAAPLTRITRGSDVFPNNEAKLNKPGTYRIGDAVREVRRPKKNCVCREA